MGNCFAIQLQCDQALIAPCLDCGARQAAYVCQLEDNLKDLMTAIEDLKDVRNEVSHRVHVEEGPTMTPTERVKRWLKRAEEKIKEAEDLIKESPKEVKKLCVGGCCSKNCISSYSFGKRVSRSLKDVKDQKAEGVFEEVVQPAGEVPTGEMPCESTVGMETMFHKVRSYLMDEQVRIVGLHGMGGVGKTTLLTRINNELSNAPNNFDPVIWVTVSKDLRLERVQEVIAKRLRFSGQAWECKTFEEKAQDILNVLKRKKFVLLLDDIWERLDLVKVGVPTGQIGTKVIFTTRSYEVCRLMKAQPIFKIEPLEWKEAWKLFKGNVGEDIINCHQDIPPLAQAVAKKCDGLPIALITVARAMAGKKTAQEWERAFGILKESASKIRGVEEEVFSLLKFSYDCLENDAVKSCFLYCALFPEDFEIPKNDLIDYWMCENFSDDRNHGYDIIGTLTRACLLEGEDDFVKMHDVIREMALWLTTDSEEGEEKFFVQTGAQLNKIPEIQKWEGINRMSLMRNEIKELIEVPACINLTTLFLSWNHLSGRIILGRMKKLTVLDMSNSQISKLPEGISELDSLVFLDLSGANIEVLSDEILKLRKLRHLNLDHNFHLRFIPKGIIDSLSWLQFLGLNWCEFGFKIDEKNNLLSDETFGIKDIQRLKYLNVFHVTINLVSSLHELSKSTEFLRLRSLMGTTCLSLSLLANLKQVEYLCIADAKELEEVSFGDENTMKDEREETDASSSSRLYLQNIVKSRNYRLFNSLTKVVIYRCSNLCDFTWLVLLAPNLKELSVYTCDKLEEIISGRKVNEIVGVGENLNVLGKLRCLDFFNLSKLKSIHSHSLPFPCLKEIKVRWCPMLKKLPLNSNSVKEHQLAIRGAEEWWNDLEWEDDATKAHFLPCFKEIYS